MSLARQRLHKAFSILKGAGDKQERLAFAFTEQLLRLRMEDFPSELRKDFAALVARMCKSGLHQPVIQCRQRSSSISINEMDMIIEMMAVLYINVSCRTSSCVTA